MAGKVENRRYYLHRQIKKKGIRYNPSEYTVYLPYDHQIIDKHVLLLQAEFAYAIQTEIV